MMVISKTQRSDLTMKNYSETEISKIVSDCSNIILEKNVPVFVNEAMEIAKADTNNTEKLVDMLVLLYHKTQQNCCDTITEVLKRILND